MALDAGVDQLAAHVVSPLQQHLLSGARELEENHVLVLRAGFTDLVALQTAVQVVQLEARWLVNGVPRQQSVTQGKCDNDRLAQQDVEGKPIRHGSRDTQQPAIEPTLVHGLDDAGGIVLVDRQRDPGIGLAAGAKEGRRETMRCG